MPDKGDFSLLVPGNQILEINNTNNNETLKKPSTQGGGVPQEESVLKPVHFLLITNDMYD